MVVTAGNRTGTALRSSTALDADLRFRNLRHLAGYTLRALASFEFLFVLYLGSGRLKAYPLLAMVPVDITALTGGVCGIAAIIVLFRKKLSLPRPVRDCVLLFSAFIGWAVLSQFWTHSTSYAQEKLLYFPILTGGAFLLAVVIVASERERLHRFLLLYLVFGLFVPLAFVQIYLTYASVISSLLKIRTLADQGGEFISAYIAVARQAAFGALLSAMFLIQQKNRNVGLVFLLITGVTLGAALVAGSKGAVMSLFFAAITYLTLTRYWPRDERRVIGKRMLAISVVGVVVLALSVIYTADATGSTWSRFALYFTKGDTSATDYVRSELFEAGWRAWLSAPLLGHGIGGFPIGAGFGDVRTFPHNLFLEVGSEFGIVGLLLIALVGVQLISDDRFAFKYDHVASTFVAVIAVFLFANQMVSGHLSDDRDTFANYGLLAYGGWMTAGRSPLASREVSRTRPVAPSTSAV